MCGSMVDIQSPTAEITRGKKEEDRKKPQGKNIMPALFDRAAINGTRPRPLVALAAVHYPGSVYRCRASRGQSTVKCSALL